MDARQSAVEALFHAALDLPRDQRRAFVEASDHPPEVRREVLDLLAHYERGRDVFQLPPAEKISLPERVGPYRIISVLGEGGMGVVYLAEQTDPFPRQVALKLIKAGMDSAQVLERFAAERDLLAMLDHPRIAGIYDAGTTEDGRPWFAMEYVPGEPITTYCDRVRLGPHGRIELFQEVCRAIQFAHQKGVIHRDIKPGNVLVVHDGERPTVKVIDFGIAKAMEGDLSEAQFTRTGQLVGTLEYMSPEQANLRAIDTRADVYALGLLLYELMVGIPPFDATVLRERGYEAMLRVIREDDPPVPSQRVTNLHRPSDVAQRRGISPRTLARLLRGDLDWILLRSLEKDPDRRYSSVAEFSADLSRHLRNEPVEARPPSASYRLRKFARRHTLGVTVATMAVLALAVIAVVSTVQSRRVSTERDRATYEAEVSREVATFLADVFHNASAERGSAERVTLDQAMQLGVERLDREVEAITPEAKLRLLRIFGSAYAALGASDQAEPLIRRAIEMAQSLEGELLELAESRFALVQLLGSRGRQGEVLELGEQILPIFEQELGSTHPRTQRCRYYYARALGSAGRQEDSITQFERLRDEYAATLDPNHPRLGMLLNELANQQSSLGRTRDALASARHALRIMEAHYGENHVFASMPMSTVANLSMMVGEIEPALETLDRLEAITVAAYGPDTPQLVAIHASRGWAYTYLDSIPAAHRAFRAAVEHPAIGASAAQAAEAFLGLAAAERSLGNLGAARSALGQARESFAEVHAEGHHRRVDVLTEQARIAAAAGEVASADSVLLAAIQLGRSLLTPDRPAVLRARLARAGILLEAGRLDQAQAEADSVAAQLAEESGRSPLMRRSWEQLQSRLAAARRTAPE